MNVIFGIILILSTLLLTVTAPEKVLTTFLTGGEKALNLSVQLLIVYAVWMGVFEMLEKSGLSTKFARLLRPVNRLLFGDVPPLCNDYMALNISANVLGMSGATTPMGIKSVMELEKHKNTEYAIQMFFVVNATSVQIIPSSVLALRSKLGSTSPADIILPTILATLVSTVVGILLVKIFIKKPQKEDKGFIKNRETLPPTPTKRVHKEKD